MASTTIKVPVELRDRLAALAEREDTTLAGAITRSLDAAEEAAFWVSVSQTLGASHRATNGAGQDRVDARLESRVTAEALSGDLTDGLDPEESWDDVW